MITNIFRKSLLLALILGLLSPLFASTASDRMRNITIGDGQELSRVPVDMYYKNSLFQMIIFADEIGDVSGYISGLTFYNQFVSDLQNKYTKIWVQTTSAQNLISGWIPITDASTLVFDGLMNYPSGNNPIHFNFSVPLPYFNDGNLLITVQRTMDVEYHNSEDKFQAQTIGTNRARVYQSDYFEIDPTAFLDSGTLSGTFPMTTIVMIPVFPAELSGTVSSEGAPLEGVQVQLEGTQHQAITADDGQYQIQYILPGSYNLIFSKPGYQPQSQELVLGEGDSLVVDAQLEPISSVTVSGRVLASDTGSGLEGAFLTLTGYAPYAAAAGEDGYFSFNDVFMNQSYTYTIVAQGYSTLTGTIDVGSTDYDMGDITINEVTSPPSYATATLNSQEMVVTVNWGSPGLRYSSPLREADGDDRALEGFGVYRLRAGQENDQESWMLLTDEPVSGNSFVDEMWIELPGGIYRWAVKTVYTNGVYSPATISNSLIKEAVTGNLTGTVRGHEGQLISEAIIKAAQEQTQTDAEGYYVLTLEVGTHTVTVSAEGYYTVSYEDIPIIEDQTTTLDIMLHPTSVEDPSIPSATTALQGINPNPFNPRTTIHYMIKEPGPVRLEIFNMRGQKVRKLFAGFQDSGEHSVVFEARDESGNPLSSGIYLCRLSAGGVIDLRKMLLSK